MIASRQAPGNRGSLRLYIFGSLEGLEWNMLASEQLKLNIFGQPDQIIRRGYGHGISKQTERFIITGRGFPKEFIEAWANLWSEFAGAGVARQDGTVLPADYLSFPQILEGVDRVRFIEACVSSNNIKKWVKIL